MAKGNRQSKRREIHVPFVCWEPDNEERSGEGKDLGTKDISAGGISFVYKEAYQMGTTLYIDLYLPGVKKPLKADMKVVRIEKEPNRDGFLIGTSFTDLPVQDRLAIDTAVNKNNLQMLLQSVIDGGGSDLHLTVGRSPMVRRKGRIMPMAAEQIEDGEIEAMLYPLLSADRINYFEEKKELDFSFSPDVNTRFRVNMHWQKGQMEATLRVVPTEVSTFEELGLPVNTMKMFCDQPSGLILISGSVGVGKTTTMAAMIEYVNTTQSKVIITIEDPIEYVFTSKRCIIKQRELGSDTSSYVEALDRSLRQDPDVICIGEIKETDCLMAAIRAAETGYLVIATAHGVDAAGTIERIMGMVPSGQKEVFAQSLASSLKGIVYQKLLPGVSGGQVLATEVLINTGPIYNLIKTNRTTSLSDSLLSGRASGMYPFQISLKNLYEQGLITKEVFERNSKVL